VIRVRTVVRSALIVSVAVGSLYFLFHGYLRAWFKGYPLTVDAAADEVICRLSEPDKQALAGTKKEDLIVYHMRLGMAIRNEFGLWDGNPALMESACNAPCQPDDASMVIIERTWERLHADTQECSDAR
jgi:hypothetical protein